jgi:hypothetical protein
LLENCDEPPSLERNGLRYNVPASRPLDVQKALLMSEFPEKISTLAQEKKQPGFASYLTDPILEYDLDDFGGTVAHD